MGEILDAGYYSRYISFWSFPYILGSSQKSGIFFISRFTFGALIIYYNYNASLYINYKFIKKKSFIFIKDNSKTAKANRASLEYDHFLGSQSFAQIEHKYKKKTVYTHAYTHMHAYTLMYAHAHIFLTSLFYLILGKIHNPSESSYGSGLYSQRRIWKTIKKREDQEDAGILILKFRLIFIICNNLLLIIWKYFVIFRRSWMLSSPEHYMSLKLVRMVVI